MKFSIVILSTAATIFTPACGDPCLPKIYADTTIVQAPAVCDDDNASDVTGGAEDSVSSTGSGGACELPAGSAWGPCAEGGICDLVSHCIKQYGASLCAPICDGNDQCSPDSCEQQQHPSCSADLPTPLCGYTCKADADCHPGQACKSSLCMWPD